MATNNLKTESCVYMDEAGGFDGPFRCTALVLGPTTTAGVYTVRSTNSATGPILGKFTNLILGSTVIPLDGATYPGIYMDTPPTGGTLNLVLK